MILRGLIFTLCSVPKFKGILSRIEAEVLLKLNLKTNVTNITAGSIFQAVGDQYLTNSYKCKINIQHVVYNENAISVSLIPRNLFNRQFRLCLEQLRKEIAVVTNFSQFIRLQRKRISEADFAFRKQYCCETKRFAGV